MLMTRSNNKVVNSDLIAKSLQLKYNEVLQSFFNISEEISGTNVVINKDNEMLDVVKLLKYYYACPPQQSFSNILDKIKAMN